MKSVRFEDGSSDVYLGVYYSYSISYSKGLFSSCPLEEVYIGRNIKYKDRDSSYPFASNPDKYGYSAFYNQPKLAKVTIGEGCTSLTDYLFYKNATITILSLPNVRTIGNSTFQECAKLATLNLGSSIETVGNSAFYNCSNITKLTFPNSIKDIGNSAFGNCTSITEVTVGSGLKTIGDNAFYNCRSFTAVILPDSLTTMGASAFESCTKLTIAKLGKSLTSVPAKAFKNCIALSEMVIPNTVEVIGDQAFYNDSTIATITMNEGLKTIGSEVFWNNSGIMRFTIPGTVTSMGTNCFYGCTNVTYLIFKEGEGTLNINNSNCRSSKIDALTTNTTYRDRKYDYFYDCPIRFLTIGKNLTYSGYSESVSIYNPETNRTETRASAPFVNHTNLRSVTIGSKVTFLYHHLLNGCSSLTKLTMPSGMESIHSYALANCTGITSLTFPNPLVLLGDHACENNTNLASVIFNEEQGNSLSLTIGGAALSNCPALTELIIPSKATSIGNYCFKNSPNIVNIRFTDSSKAISLGTGSASNNSMFGDCSLQSLYMGRNISYPTTGASYSPFYNQSYLTDVKFSQVGTITYCKDYLLYGVNNCETLLLPESITELGRYSFAEMTALKGIEIPSMVTHLKEGLLSGDENITSIVIHPAVVSMESYLFRNCKRLASVTFEDAPETLSVSWGASNSNYGLFRDCPIETLYLGRWLSYNTESPERSPFYSISTLKNLTFGENVGVVDKYMFSYCSGLEELYLPDNIGSVGLWGFRGCSSLKSVRFSNNLSQISDYAFSGCSSLDNVSFPASMTSVADNSFSNCTSLRNLDLGESLMIIGPSAFKNCSALEGIEIPETLYGLGVEAFANCTSLPSVTIKSISSVAKQAFQGCTGLKWVSLSDKTTSLGENSFDGCTNIAYVKSYAEFPPEGLVNFPEEVVANGTVFVPEYSIDYYQYSPTWENWYSFRPITEDVLVTSITLNHTESNIKAQESVELIASVGSDDAVNKEIIWRSSNESVATVNSDGVVEGVAVGEADITAIAADGSGVKAICKIIVDPTLMESISIDNGGVETIKKGRTLELSVAILPVTTTNPSVVWSSSNQEVATVSELGVVNAITAGDVIITATGTDGSGVETSFSLSVIPPTTGDSNDNDVVTITDAVNTANYAVGIETANFCFEAADVNKDNQITLSDASGTVAVVLEQSIVPSMLKKHNLYRNVSEMDCIVIDDFSITPEKTETVAVKLDNSVDYVALQADIVVPDDLLVEGVNIGSRAELSHKLTIKRLNNNTIRLALFALDNATFADNDEAIVELKIKGAANSIGDIEAHNIIAADAQANEYMLASVGGHYSDLTGLDNVNGVSDIVVTVDNNIINIENAQGENVTLYSPNGTPIANFVAQSAFESHSVVSGVYIVVVGDVVTKVIVK
ncbi:MAG: leucine-rich repeat protein [Bacteroidales bacterium]|nr:leucine-rich repeat protein [Bacteroidales bacterium]